MARARPGIVAVVATGALLAAGCGASGHSSSRSSSARGIGPTSSAKSSARRVHAAAPRNSTEAPVDPAAVGVIMAWSDALRRGDLHARGRLFTLPSKLINGVGSGGVAQ